MIYGYGMKTIDFFLDEIKVVRNPLQSAIQKNVLVNVAVKCDFEPGSILDLTDAIFESLEEEDE